MINDLLLLLNILIGMAFVAVLVDLFRFGVRQRLRQSKRQASKIPSARTVLARIN